MKFQNDNHRQHFLRLLSMMKRNDAYHQSVAYLMALVPMDANDVFDFQNDCIKHEGLYARWQTSSSRKATRLLFNLWNGCYEDHAAETPEKTSYYYAVDEIFSNYEYAPWFMEAVRIRFEWIYLDE